MGVAAILDRGEVSLPAKALAKEEGRRLDELDSVVIVKRCVKYAAHAQNNLAECTLQCMFGHI